MSKLSLSSRLDSNKKRMSTKRSENRKVKVRGGLILKKKRRR